MPRVPVYERQFEKEGVNLGAPTQNISAPAEAFGAGDAKGLTNLGQGAASVGTAMMVAAKRMKDEEDEAKALDAYVKFHESTSTLLHGDGTEANPGFYGRQGGTALGATREAREAFEKSLQDVSSSLGNDQQRSLFRRRAETLRLESLTGVSRHESGQRKVYQAETNKAVAGREAEYALLNYTDPNAVESALGRGIEAVKSAARLSGLSPEAADKAVADYQSDALKKVALRHITNGNFSLAQEIKADKRMTGADAAAVETSLKTEQDLARVFGVADAAMQQDDPLAWVREQKNLDPATRGKVEAQVKSNISWERTERQERERVDAQAFEDNLVKAIDRGDMGAANRLVESSPPGLRKEARAYVMARAEGRDIVDDPAEKWRWTQMLADEPEKFKQSWNSPAMMAKLSPATRSQFDSAYIQLGKKDGKAPVVDEILSDKQIIDGAAGAVGINLKTIDTNVAMAEKYAAFSNAYARRVEETMRVKGGKLTTTEKQALMDDLLLKGKVKGGGWFGDKQTTRFEAGFNENLKDKPFVPDVTRDPVGFARSEARSQGLPEALAVAVMRAESGGNPNAVSPKGAVGYFQLMPDAAKEMGVKREDPEGNIRGGVGYLKKQVERFKDERLALMAYNWGPQATQNWLDSGADPKRVPAETVEYVRRVLSYKR